MEQRDEAVAEFEKCIRVAPGFDQSYLNLARVYSIEGHPEKARALLLDLLKQHPDHIEAKRALEGTPADDKIQRHRCSRFERHQSSGFRTVRPSRRFRRATRPALLGLRPDCHSLWLVCDVRAGGGRRGNGTLDARTRQRLCRGATDLAEACQVAGDVVVTSFGRGWQVSLLITSMQANTYTVRATSGRKRLPHSDHSLSKTMRRGRSTSRCLSRPPNSLTNRTSPSPESPTRSTAAATVLTP